MSLLPGAVFSLLPAAGLFLAFPRRPWTCLAAAGLSLVGGLGVLLFALAPELALMAATFWGILGGCCGFLVCVRRKSDHEELSRNLEEARVKSRELAGQLAEFKASSSAAEREQKETLALYGMIKSLSEALSWDDIKPKLESAVDQYLGLSEFAFYAVSTQGGYRLLTVKRLEGSPGASWATLERYLQEHGLTPAQSYVSENPELAVALPIQENGELLGYFYARLPKGSAPSTFMAKAQTFAAEISFAFRRIKLFQEVESLSQIDGLTGVYRRGDFDERLRQETVRAKTFKTTCGLMLLDIDHFKELNDRYGHPFGDQVLRRIGELLNASVYETDFVARYGGEEFVVILPRAEPEGASRKAESIRAAIENEKFPIAFDSVRVTVSIGIAHFPSDAATPEELVAQADAAMYQAKSSGRNRVVDSYG